MWSHQVKLKGVLRECSRWILGDMFSKPGKTKKIAKTWDIINYLLPHCFIQFSFEYARNRRNQILSEHMGWSLENKMMVNHVPFMHSYLGFGAWVFFPKLAHNIPFPWTILLLRVPNVFLDSSHNTNFYYLLGLFWVFFSRSLVKIFHRVTLALPYYPFWVPLCHFTQTNLGFA